MSHPIRLETRVSVWQASRGGIYPISPEFTTRLECVAWCRENLTGFYVVRGY